MQRGTKDKRPISLKVCKFEQYNRFPNKPTLYSFHATYIRCYKDDFH